MFEILSVINVFLAKYQYLCLTISAGAKGGQMAFTFCPYFCYYNFN